MTLTLPRERERGASCSSDRFIKVRKSCIGQTESHQSSGGLFYCLSVRFGSVAFLPLSFNSALIVSIMLSPCISVLLYLRVLESFLKLLAYLLFLIFSLNSNIF